MGKSENSIEILKLLGEFKRLDKKRLTGLSTAESARFDELSNKLESFLDRKSLGKQPKRKELRVPCAHKIQVQNTADLKKFYIHNISGGGIYVTSEDYLPVGSSIEIDIFVEEGQRSQRLKGVVAWVNTKDIQGLPPGMGIKFASLTSEQEAFLKEVIHAELTRTVKEEPS